VFCLCLAAGLLVACWILRSACSCQETWWPAFLKVHKGLRVCANIFFLLTDHKSREVLFSSGTDLVKTGLKVLVWSVMWLGPILQMNWGGSLAGVFLKNSDGLLCLGAPSLTYTILLCRLLKPSCILRHLGACCNGWMLSVWLVRLGPAAVFGCCDLQHLAALNVLPGKPPAGHH